MSKIEWTNETWNPITGCDKVSQGCKNCYAEIMHKRLMGMFPSKYSKPFLGNVELHPEDMHKPLHYGKKPKMVFVNSMSDLFHKDVPFDFIDNVFAVMDCCPQHTFQILTKRPDRMLEYFDEKRDWRVGDLKKSFDSNDVDLNAWPLKNVWLGVSVEDQKTADQRIPFLLQCPAAVRFLSCEPLLEYINISSILLNGRWDYHQDIKRTQRVQWVIAGGESGRHARPLHADWIRAIRDQCKAAGVPFFFKQWGEFVPVEDHRQPPFLVFPHTGNVIDGHHIDIVDPDTGEAGKYLGYRFMDGMDAVMYCVELKSDPCNFLRVGKANGGNSIDGKQHLNFPDGPKD